MLLMRGMKQALGLAALMFALTAVVGTASALALSPTTGSARPNYWNHEGIKTK